MCRIVSFDVVCFSCRSCCFKSSLISYNKKLNNVKLKNVSNILIIYFSPPKTTVVSGAPVHGHADYPAEAVLKFHEKPLPTHESRCSTVKPFIQQPKKQ